MNANFVYIQKHLSLTFNKTGRGCVTEKLFCGKCVTVLRIAALQNFVSSEALATIVFHWLIKLITFADEK